MSLDQDQVEVVETPNAGVSIPGESAPAPEAQSDDVESRARAMGWRPKDEFSGPEDKWRTAEDFVKRGEEELPIVRERLRDTTRKVTEMEQRLARQEAESRDKLGRIERMSLLALERQKAQIESSYEAAMRDAAASADVQRYDQLRRDQGQALVGIDQQIMEAARPAKQPNGYTPLPEPVANVVNSWVAENPWFDRDPVLRTVAEARNQELMRDHPGMDAAENLKRVKQFVQQKFPEKFGITQRATVPASVEGGTRMPSAGGARSKGWDDLPSDVRNVGERQIREKLFKDKSEFAREYWSQD